MRTPTQRRVQAEKESAAIIGFTSAIAAYGAFFIPKSYGTSIAMTGSPVAALWGFFVFYLSCIAVTWWRLHAPRRRAARHRARPRQRRRRPPALTDEGAPNNEPLPRSPDLLQRKYAGTFANGHGDDHRPRTARWEDAYRPRWAHDKIVRSTHGANCTGSCSWKIYVKGGIVTWETQQTDYPRTRPDLPNHEPRGCSRGASYSWYLYSANRVKYPMMRKRLLRLWRAAKAQHADPVAAWAVDPGRRDEAPRIPAGARPGRLRARRPGTRRRRSSPPPTSTPPSSTARTASSASRRSRRCRWSSTPPAAATCR